MASDISRILTQALLAKAPLVRDVGKIYKSLSGIPMDDALRVVPDYFAAVANIVALDTNEVIGGVVDRDVMISETRKLLMGYLDEAKTRPESSGEFLGDASRLLVNVQRVWVALAQERPLNGFFELAQTYPQLVLPKAFAMRAYFKANEIDADTMKTIGYAVEMPKLASGNNRKTCHLKRGPVYH